MKEFVDHLVGSVRESVRAHSDEAFEDGYNEAANICVGILSETINGLLKKIKQGSYLSDQEQFLLAKLNELQSETETALRDFRACADIG